MNSQETPEVEIIEDFSPLDAPVKKRSYTQHKIVDNAETVADLEEPTFQAPSFEDFNPKEEATKEPERPFNESFSELDGKEKSMGAEMMAEMTLDIYEKGCGFLGKLPEISESKLDNLINDGEIDPNIELETGNGQMPVKEFAQEFNGSIKEAFEVTDDFKDKVRPPLIRVFKKRGIGMTDEQLLAYYFVTDLGTKTAQAFMLRKTANNILDSLKANTQALRENGAQRPAPAPAPTSTPSPKEENIEFYESFSDQEVVVPKKPRKPKTNLEEQVEFFEPEEGGSVYSNLQDGGGFVKETPMADNMPKFGDPDILAQLEKLSNSPQKPVRKRTVSTPKKPRKTRGSK